jgi:hypothetical protein
MTQDNMLEYQLTELHRQQVIRDATIAHAKKPVAWRVPNTAGRWLYYECFTKAEQFALQNYMTAEDVQPLYAS